MEKVPTGICPLRSIGQPELAPCLESRCAWFHVKYDEESSGADGACVLVSIADGLDVIQRFGED